MVMDEVDAIEDLQPLDIKCTSSDCEQGLHCFRRTVKMRESIPPGTCRSCGTQLIDIRRLHDRNLDDVQHTFDSLRMEQVRHHFWHTEIDQKAVNHARRKGRAGIREAAKRRIRTSVGRAGSPFDGRQTPYRENSLYYAQHAVAACCRKCIEEWHGIPMDRDLDEGEIEYLSQLVNKYVLERLPDLTEEGERVPPMSRTL